MKSLKPKNTTQIFIALLLILLTLQITVSISSFSRINQTYRSSQDMNVVGNLRWLTQRLGRSSMEIITNTPSADTKAQISQDINRIDIILHALEYGNETLAIEPTTMEEHLELLVSINITWVEYKELVTNIKDGEINLETTATRQQTISSLTILSDSIVRDVDTYIYLAQEDVRQTIKNITFRAMLTGIISSLFIFFFWYILLKRGILNPMNSLESGMRSLNEGNTQIRIPLQGSPEMQNIITEYNRLSMSLHDLVTSLTNELNSIVSFNSDLIELNQELIEITQAATEKNLVPSHSETPSDMSEPLSLVEEISHACNNIGQELDRISKETQLPELNLTATQTREQVESFKHLFDNLVLTHSSTRSLLNNINAKTTSLLQTSLATAAYADNIRDRLEYLETNMPIEDILRLKQIDQEMWKQRVHLYLLGYGTINIEEILDETVCKLGHWIHNNGQDHFANLPRFLSLKEHHTKYHQVAHRILDMGINNSAIFEELASLEQFSQLIAKDLQELERIVLEGS